MNGSHPNQLIQPAVQPYPAAVQMQQLQQMQSLLQVHMQLQQMQRMHPNLVTQQGGLMNQPSFTNLPATMLPTTMLQNTVPVPMTIPTQPSVQVSPAPQQSHGTVMQPTVTMPAHGGLGRMKGRDLEAELFVSPDLVRVMKYSCGYCGQVKVSASAGINGRVRIRCDCGGKNRDNIPRMHAMWDMVKDIETSDEPLTFKDFRRKTKRQKTAQAHLLNQFAGFDTSNVGNDIRVCVIDDQFGARMLSIKLLKLLNPSSEHQIPEKLKSVNAIWQNNLVKVGVDDPSEIQECLDWVNLDPMKTIVLLDRVLEFPDAVIDGLSLIPQLSANGALVLVFSGSDSAEDQQLYESHGAFGCVGKVMRGHASSPVLDKARQHILSRSKPAHSDPHLVTQVRNGQMRSSMMGNGNALLDPPNILNRQPSQTISGPVATWNATGLSNPANMVTHGNSMGNTAALAAMVNSGAMLNGGAMMNPSAMANMASVGGMVNGSIGHPGAMANSGGMANSGLMVPVDPSALANIADMAGFNLVPKTQPSWFM